MRIVAIPHKEAAKGLAENSIEVAVNPPVTVRGMEDALEMLPDIRGFGPFLDPLYCSPMARALGTASVYALGLDLEIKSIKNLAEHGNVDVDLDGNRKLYVYPGHKVDFIASKEQFVKALVEIENDGPKMSLAGSSKEESEPTVLVISHRLKIGAGVVACDDRFTDDQIKEVAMTLGTEKKFVIFHVNNGKVTS